MNPKWTKWGGNPDCPVKPGTRTEIKLASGSTFLTERPAHFPWNGLGDARIVAYREFPK